eukprot:COSAG01_NODE_1270_length_10961_cov_34.289423_6_plen_80_part_00
MPRLGDGEALELLSMVGLSDLSNRHKLDVRIQIRVTNYGTMALSWVPVVLPWCDCTALYDARRTLKNGRRYCQVARSSG